jgi:hypothetical protein
MTKKAESATLETAIKRREQLCFIRLQHVRGAKPTRGLNKLHCVGPKDFVFGRLPDSDCAIIDPAISRRHAYLSLAEDPNGRTQLTVTDDFSLQGMQIKNIVATKTKLKPDEPTVVNINDLPKFGSGCTTELIGCTGR